MREQVSAVEFYSRAGGRTSPRGAAERSGARVHTGSDCTYHVYARSRRKVLSNEACPRDIRTKGSSSRFAKAVTSKKVRREVQDRASFYKSIGL